MLISNINNRYSLNFRAIQLSTEESKKAAVYINDLLNSQAAKTDTLAIKNKLFSIFDKHLQQEALIKTRATRMYRDVLAEICLQFSELLYNIKETPEVELFVGKLNEYNPSKNTVKPEYSHLSLNTKINENSPPVTCADIITEKNLPNPKSAIDIEKDRDKLETAVEKALLSDVIKRRLQKRASGVTYSDIAQEENVNIRTIEQSVQKGVLKTQNKNNCLSPKYIEKARELAAVFKCDEKEVIKIMSRHADIISKNPKSISQNIKKAAELLNCTEEEFIKAALKQPTLLGMKPETILQGIKEKTALFNCDTEKLIKIALSKHPPLFFTKTDTITKNIKESSEVIGCSEKEFIDIGLKNSTLFYMKPETIQNNIKKSAALLNCSEKEFIKIAMKQQNLFYFKPETLKGNVDKSSKLLGCSVEDFVKASLKYGTILYQKPESLKNNVAESAKQLEISEEEFVKMALRHTPLFILKPETLRKNAEEMAKIMDISVGEYVRLMSGRPAILSQKSESLKKKIQISMFYRKIKNEEAENIINQSADAVLYSVILAHLIKQLNRKELEDFVRVKRKFNLETFLKANSDKHFVFMIPDDEVAKDFVKFVQETSVKTIGKSIFEFKS